MSKMTNNYCKFADDCDAILHVYVSTCEYIIAYDNRAYAAYGSNTSNIQCIINDTRISNSFVWC